MANATARKIKKNGAATPAVTAPPKPEVVKPSQDEKPCLCSELFVTLHRPAEAEGDREMEFVTGCDESVRGKRNFAAGHDAKLKKAIFAAVRQSVKDGLDWTNPEQVNWDFKGVRYTTPSELALKNLTELLANQVHRGVEVAGKVPEPKAATAKGGSPKPKPKKAMNVVAAVNGKQYSGRAYADGSFVYRDAEDNEVEVPGGQWALVAEKDS